MRGVVRIGNMEIGTISDGKRYILPAKLYFSAISGEGGKYELVYDYGISFFEKVDKISPEFYPEFLTKKGIEPLPVKNLFTWDYVIGVKDGFLIAYYYDDEKIVRLTSLKKPETPLVPFVDDYGVIVYDPSTRKVVNVLRKDEIEDHLVFVSHKVERYYMKKYGLNVSYRPPGEYVIMFSEKGKYSLTSVIDTQLKTVNYVVRPDGLYVMRNGIKDVLDVRNRVFEWEVSTGDWIIINNVNGVLEFSIGGWIMKYDAIMKNYSIVSSEKKYKLKNLSLEDAIELLKGLITFGEIIIEKSE